MTELKKWCPLLSLRAPLSLSKPRLAECLEEKCAWWIKYNYPKGIQGNCVIKAIAECMEAKE